MIRDDYIVEDKMSKVIHKVYTPKEIAHLVQETFNYIDGRDLSMSERLLLMEFCNQLIWRIKDD